MGILLYTHSVAFAEDLEIELEPGESITSFFTKAWGKYESAVCVNVALHFIGVSLESRFEYGRFSKKSEKCQKKLYERLAFLEQYHS